MRVYRKSTGCHHLSWRGPLSTNAGSKAASAYYPVTFLPTWGRNKDQKTPLLYLQRKQRFSLLVWKIIQRNLSPPFRPHERLNRADGAADSKAVCSDTLCNVSIWRWGRVAYFLQSHDWGLPPHGSGQQRPIQIDFRIYNGLCRF